MEANDNPQENNLDKHTKNKVEEVLQEKELKIKWREELENNPAVIEYFKKFRNQDPKKEFLDNYLNKKYQCYTYGDMYKASLERNRNKWIELAHEHLQYILQKKLFDLQCLWRAGQVTFEELKITLDFKIWEYDILNCPFLEPITAEEINMYQEFLRKHKTFEEGWFDFFIWQDYDDIKNSYVSNNEDEVDQIPEWYEYHNNKTGNGSLLILPDIRGEKENFYLSIYRESVREQQAQNTTNTPVEVDNRPFLNIYDEEVIQFFVDTFEDKEMKKKYYYYQEGTKDIEEEQKPHDLLDCIIEAGETIPVEAHHNILEALETAYNKYTFNKIADHLPIAYEQYLFSKKMGIQFEKKEDSYFLNLRNLTIENILDAREMNGEERNFDY